MTKRQKKFMLIALGLAILASVTALVLNAFQSNLVFFFTPTQVFAGEAPKGRAFRIGGMVKASSLVQVGMTHEFVVTDNEREVSVTLRDSCPICSKRAEAWWLKGSWTTRGGLWPPKCWPNTMRTTCPLMPSMPWTRRPNAGPHRV